MAEKCEQGLLTELIPVARIPATDAVERQSLPGVGRSLLQLAEWSERLEFGVPEIDAQHRQFYELAASFDGNTDQVRVMKTLALLSDYIRRHFRDEEELMAAWNYPGLKAHCRLHAHFRHMLADLFSRAGHMALDEIGEEVRYLINGWFSNHIVTVDFEYAPYVAPGHAVRRRRSIG